MTKISKETKKLVANYLSKLPKNILAKMQAEALVSDTMSDEQARLFIHQCNNAIKETVNE